MKARVSGAKGSKRKRHEQATAQLPEFVKGQIWKVPDAYVLITEVGKLLIHYRLGPRPGMHATPSRVSTKEEVRIYLERNAGVQVQSVTSHNQCK